MADSFTVDPSALGQIPSMLDGARSALAGIQVGPVAGAAANGAAPGSGGGIEAFGRALDAFVAAGCRAIDQDIGKLRQNAVNYDRTERAVVTEASMLSCRVGGQR